MQFSQTYIELGVSCGLLLPAQLHPMTMGPRLVFQGLDLACYITDVDVLLQKRLAVAEGEGLLDFSYASCTLLQHVCLLGCRHSVFRGCWCRGLSFRSRRCCADVAKASIPAGV